MTAFVNVTFSYSYYNCKTKPRIVLISVAYLFTALRTHKMITLVGTWARSHYSNKTTSWTGLSNYHHIFRSSKKATPRSRSVSPFSTTRLSPVRRSSTWSWRTRPRRQIWGIPVSVLSPSWTCRVSVTLIRNQLSQILSLILSLITNQLSEILLILSVVWGPQHIILSFARLRRHVFNT